jgi:hypothetical protein
MGANVEDLLEPLETTRAMISVGHSVCIIDSSILQTVRENVQGMDNAR